MINLEEMRKEIEKSSLYQYLSNEWYKLTKEDLSIIAKELSYVLYQELGKKISDEIDRKVVEQIKETEEIVEYRISFGGGYGESHIIQTEEETTDYKALIDILIDRFDEQGRGDCFLTLEEVESEEYPSDTYIIGGNYGSILYTGGNLNIEKID